MGFDDHYAVLGLPRGASEADIRKAYRQLVLRYHPDRNQDDPAAEERFKEITAAYEIIGDPELRAAYDETLRGFDDATAASIAEAERRRREAAEAKRRASAGAQRRSRPRMSYRFESNELKSDDVGNGIAFGAATWCFLSVYLLRTGGPLSFGAAVLLSVSALAGALFGFRVGEPVSRVAGSIAEALDAAFWIESACAIIPMVAAIAIAAVVIDEVATLMGTGFSWWSLPGMLGGGAAGAIGSGFGRAFTSVAERASSKAFGVLVGALVGAAVGALVGMLLVSFGSAHVLDNAVFDRMFGAAAGATLGGALASAIGSLKSPG